MGKEDHDARGKKKVPVKEVPLQEKKNKLNRRR